MPISRVIARDTWYGSHPPGARERLACVFECGCTSIRLDAFISFIWGPRRRLARADTVVDRDEQDRDGLVAFDTDAAHVARAQRDNDYVSADWTSVEVR